MLFHTPIFLLLFTIVWLLYWGPLRRHHRLQNWMLLIASYIFYGSWNWALLPLLILSTVIDFAVARKIDRQRSPLKKKYWLGVSLVFNLGVLGTFKYFNFFVGSLSKLLATVGLPVGLPVLNIILPLGVSFYTFQTLSYVIDVYREDIKPAKRLDDFALFVAFFPQLVAGPIERADNLLPQVVEQRQMNLERWRRGLTLFLWGVWLKMYLADGLALIVEKDFALAAGAPLNLSSLQAWLGAWGFAWEIYADFYGYSLMARGLAYLLGFELMHNFDFPFFSRNIQEFWRRWHISLSNWFRDYVYYPLGGSRGSFWFTARNLVILMTLVGLWHGPHWTFVIWGFLQGAGLVVHRAWRQNVHLKLSRPLDYLARIAGTIITFNYFALTLIIFRAPSLGVALHYLARLVSGWPVVTVADYATLIILASHILPALLIDGWQKLRGFTDSFADWYWYLRAPAAAFFLYLILFYGRPGLEFIYFVF